MAEEKTVVRKKVWLIRHPVSLFYKETQKEIKRLGFIAEVKIFDIKMKSRIDPDLVVEHGLTPIDAPDESVEDTEDVEAAKKEKAKEKRAIAKAAKDKAEKEAEDNSSE